MSNSIEKQKYQLKDNIVYYYNSYFKDYFPLCYDNMDNYFWELIEERYAINGYSDYLISTSLRSTIGNLDVNLDSQLGSFVYQQLVEKGYFSDEETPVNKEVTIRTQLVEKFI